mgnify:CR=1 FL=1
MALSLGINANLLRRWVRDAEGSPGKGTEGAAPKALPNAECGSPTFVPVQLPGPTAPVADIRLEFERGSTTVVVTWPMALATECGTWLREILR